jgi:eukaryotic-like serine/threonine-protein kinase
VGTPSAEVAITVDDDLGPDTEELATDSASGSGWLLAGRYRVLDRIGTGGMAEVFRARDEQLGRDVAVKVFRTLVDPAVSVAAAQRREIELQALASLSHPNLITLFDASISGSGDPPFLVMELVDGPTMSARLADGPLPEAEVREIAIQLADALGYVHSHGMVHRDVKPANILLGSDGTDGVRPRLSDFGIVRMLGSERVTSTELTLGTASYLAPEQARGVDVDPVADVYSLGLVLLEALTGVRCFTGTPIEAAVARLTRAPAVPAYLREPWPALLRAMTAADPASRPTAAEVVAALRSESFAPEVADPQADAAGTTAEFGTDDLIAAWSSGAEEPGDNLDTWRPNRLLAVAVVFVAAIVAAAYMFVRPVGQGRHTPGAVVTSTPVTSRPAPAGQLRHSSRTTQPSISQPSSSAAPASTGSTAPSPALATSSAAPPSTPAPSTPTTPPQTSPEESASPTPSISATANGDG